MKTTFRSSFNCFFILMIVALSGCAKTLDEYIDSILYAPKKLISRSWVKTEELHNPANVIPNSFNTLQPCAKDNAYKYDSDGYYEMNQGGSNCFSTQPFLIEQGRWEFLQNNTKLKISLSNSSVRLYNIVLLDSNLNFITTRIDSSRGTKVEVKERFSPQ